MTLSFHFVCHFSSSIRCRYPAKDKVLSYNLIYNLEGNGSGVELLTLDYVTNIMTVMLELTTETVTNIMRVMLELTTETVTNTMTVT